MHVHVSDENGAAKIWLEPEVEVAGNHGIPNRRLRRALALARERQDEIRAAWRTHFGA